jgi:hypothetical protein
MQAKDMMRRVQMPGFLRQCLLRMKGGRRS